MTVLARWHVLQREARLLAATLVQPQVSTAARERRDLLLLLIAVALVSAPHLEALPWWAIGTLLTLWGLRLGLTLAQRPAPSARFTWPLLAVVGIAVYAEHRTWLGASAGVLFLLLLMGLKLLEMRAKRDVFVVIFLSFFILLTLFLQGQGLGTALLTAIAVLLLFFVLVGANLGETDVSAQTKLKLVGVVFLKALPLTLVFFVLFPRLPGPLWGVPSAEGLGRTGLSNSMSPGSMGRLLESDAIAFRADFTGPIPSNELLYWRGPTFGFFNGRTWSSAVARTAPATLSISVEPESEVNYSITLEPHSRDWVFALEMPQVPERVGPHTVRMNADSQLLADGLITERQRYRLRSFTRFALGRNETRESLQYALQLPFDANPRTLQLARDLRQRTPGAQTRASDAALIEAVLQRFRMGGFRYTLEPKGLGRHSVDEFLFDTLEGYCEHYASAFVTLMRALDIPARVVTGYQGGELNPVDGFVTVRQSDAHAWAEVWLPQRGWVRIDPTAMVAPDRIERGTRERERQRTGAGALSRVAAFTWLREALSSVRFNWEALQNTWNQWVLSYSPERQRSLLERLGFEPDLRVLGKLLAVVMTLVLGVLAWLSLRHRVVPDPLGDAYAHLRRTLATLGVPVTSHSGPRSLTEALHPLEPISRKTAEHLLHRFEMLRYTRLSSDVARIEIKAFARAVSRFHPRRDD